MSIINDIETMCDKNDKLDKLTELMQSYKIRVFIDDLLTHGVTKKNLKDAKVILYAANCIYSYSGNSTGMSDSEYDIIYEQVQKLDPNIGFTTSIMNDKNMIGHHKYKSLRGTLDKIYALDEDDILQNKSRKSLQEWVDQSEKTIKEKTGEFIDLWEEQVYVFPKFDGLSVIHERNEKNELVRSLGRGDTEQNSAQDVTRFFTWLSPSKPDSEVQHPYALKSEVMMTNEATERYNKTYNTDYKQSRSIVSSILNSGSPDRRVEYLRVIPLRMSELIDGEESKQVLSPDVFNFPFIQCKLKETNKIRKFATNHFLVTTDDGEHLRCDGAVIYLINPKIQNILGRKDNKQKFEVAYKFTEETAYSKVEGIKFTTGLFGTINPQALIKPVKMKGNTISCISLGSMGRFNQLNLRKGDKVKILYDIIPYLVFDESDKECKHNMKEQPFAAPERCYDCGEELHKTPAGELQCINKDCPCRKKGKILNYLRQMKIENISDETVSTLYDEGYLKSIKDIYRLKDNAKKIMKIPGFGEKSVSNILNSIDSRREVDADVLLASIGIQNAGKKTFASISSVFSYDEIRSFADNDQYEIFKEVNGVGEIMAKEIANGIKTNSKLLDFLEDELVIHGEIKKKKQHKFSVAFTKIRDEDLEIWIEQHGGIIDDSLKKTTTFLVVPMAGVVSGKTQKAEKYGVKVVDINHAKEEILKEIE